MVDAKISNSNANVLNYFSNMLIYMNLSIYIFSTSQKSKYNEWTRINELRHHQLNGIVILLYLKSEGNKDSGVQSGALLQSCALYSWLG